MAQTALVGELSSRSNSGKHASKGAVAQAQTMLLQLEALLAQLLQDE